MTRRRFRTTALVLAALLAAPSAAKAQSLTNGNGYLSRCDAPADGWGSICAAFAGGALEAFTAAEYAFKTAPLCTPDAVTFAQIQGVLVKYLRANPEKRHFTTASSLWIAVAQAFPCQAPVAPPAPSVQKKDFRF